MKEKLEIETLTVEIKVIRVGGHKMTKAVWNQIARYGCNFVASYSEKKIAITGYCADEKTILGWVKCDYGHIDLLLKIRGKLFAASLFGDDPKNKHFISIKGAGILNISEAMSLYSDLPQLFIAT